jgi:dTMP kinase
MKAKKKVKKEMKKRKKRKKKKEKKGKFIVLEGIDGAGKDTQALRIVKYLKKKGCKVIRTKEHRKHSRIGKKITAIIKKGKDPYKRAEQLRKLFLQDRKEHVKELIMPSIDEGKIVVCTRYKYSALAYQTAQGTSSSKVMKDHKDFPSPDIVLVLDVDAETGLKRLAKTGKKKQVFEKKAFLEKIQKNYKSLKRYFKKEKIVMIKGIGSKEEVFARIKKHIDKIL